MSTSTNSSSSKRLLHELHEYNTSINSPTSTSTSSHPNTQPQEENECIENLHPISDSDLYRWTATLKGPKGTAYEGGKWRLDVLIPKNYPLAPPVIKFNERCCHPNINLMEGGICLDLLQTSWSPAYTIHQTLLAIHHLLRNPEPESPLNVDVARLLRDGDTIGAEGLIRYFNGE